MKEEVKVQGAEVAQIKRDFAPHRRVSIRICKNCGNVYTISDNDLVYFVEKYKQIPLRCDACRQRRREMSGQRGDK